MRKSRAALYYLQRYADKVELFLSALRFMTFIALGGLLYAIGVISASRIILLPLSGLFLSIAIHLIMVIRGQNNRWMPWFFTTAEIGFLVLTLISSARVLGLPLELALNASSIWLIFIYLVMGVLRLGPGLVLYSGLLFISAWIVLLLVPASPSYPKDIAHAADHLGRAVEISHVLRISIIVVLTAALAFSAWLSRRAISQAIAEASVRQKMSRHFPKPILDKFLGQETSAPLYQLDAAVMFIDICGFTRLSEQLDSASIAALLMRFRSDIDVIIQRRGGVIDKFMGDGALVVFGLPEATGQDALQALRCALDIESHLHGQSMAAERSGFPRIMVGIGIHYGPVLAGVIGDGARVEFTVLGDTVNVAAKLQQAANRRGGEILASEEVTAAAGFSLALSETAIRVEIPGRRNAITAIRLHGAKAIDNNWDEDEQKVAPVDIVG
jgi:adenylate cyclase